MGPRTKRSSGISFESVFPRCHLLWKINRLGYHERYISSVFSVEYRHLFPLGLYRTAWETIKEKLWYFIERTTFGFLSSGRNRCANGFENIFKEFGPECQATSLQINTSRLKAEKRAVESVAGDVNEPYDGCARTTSFVFIIYIILQWVFPPFYVRFLPGEYLEPLCTYLVQMNS